MDNLRIIAVIVLIAVICAGTIIKIYTRSRLKDLEGTYDTELPARNSDRDRG